MRRLDDIGIQPMEQGLSPANDHQVRERERERISHLKSGLKYNRTIMFEVRPRHVVCLRPRSFSNQPLPRLWGWFHPYRGDYGQILRLLTVKCLVQRVHEARRPTRRLRCKRFDGSRLGKHLASLLVVHEACWNICGDGDGSELMIPHVIPYLGRTFTYQLFF